jgi:hypothetical protein
VETLTQISHLTFQVVVLLKYAVSLVDHLIRFSINVLYFLLQFLDLLILTLYHGVLGLQLFLLLLRWMGSSIKY